MRSALLLSALLTFPPGAGPFPATGPAGLQHEPLTLMGARLRLSVLSETTADVEAHYELQGGGPLTFLLLWFPEQTLTGSFVRVNDRLLEAEFEETAGAMRRIRFGDLPAGRHAVEFGYRVGVPLEMAHRYPLPVPEASPRGEGRPVGVQVLLPPGTHFTGDSFPQLRRAAGEELTSHLIGVPSFVYVRFGPHPPGWLSTATWLELGAILAVVVLLLLGRALGRRQHRSKSPKPPA